MKKKFMLGCNYWDSVSGTDMWKKKNPDAVEKDLAALEDCGVKYLRIFPLWRDFQPLRKLYAWQGKFGEYVCGEDEECLDCNPDCIDEGAVSYFREFCGMAKKHGMKLVVSIVTGWMSGRLFVPPALEGKNLITDPEVLMWTEKYIKGLVSRIKDIDNIVMWDLGNECNCLGKATTRAEAYTWTATVRNAIYSADSSRPISSGMHSLRCDAEGEWQLCDQGSLCDYVTTHPYPSPTVNGDLEPFNGLRTTILPTAQSAFYSGVSGKPCIIQESGTFSPTLGNRNMSANFVRVNILSAWANNICGYLWWCGMEHLLLKKPPYSWSMVERELGMVDLDRKPKPVGEEVRCMSKVIYKLPELGEKQIDAICVLPRDIDKQLVAISSYILAKEAGFNISIANCETDIGESDAYILPCAKGWQVAYRRTWDFLLDRVYNHGADLLVTYDGGHFTEFEKIFGIKSHGVYKGTGIRHTAHFDFGDIKYTASNDIQLEAVNADVLAKDENGNPVSTVSSYGKGRVFFLGFAIEAIAVSQIDGFNPERNQPYYKLYREFGKRLSDKYSVKSNNPVIGVTQSKNSDGSYTVSAINYSDKKQAFAPTVSEGYKIDTVYYGEDFADSGIIPSCDGVVMKVSKE